MIYTTADAAFSHYGFGPPDKVAEFDDGHDVIVVEGRWEHPNGTRRESRHVHRVRDGWAIGNVQTPRPLFRLRAINDSDGPICVTEGPLKAATLVSLGFNATASMNGSQAAHKSDWSRCAGRKILFFADHDDAGCIFQNHVASIVTALSPPATVHTVQLPDLPVGGDVVDFVARRRGEGADDATIRAEIQGLCDAAPIYELPGDNEFDDGGNESSEGSNEENGKKDSQATTAIKLALNTGITLWHDQDRNPWATIQVEDHCENRAINSKPFRLWLASIYFRSRRRAPNAQSMQDALNALAGMAIHAGEQHRIHVRVAEYDGAIYYDLCNDEWTVVKVTPDGWNVTADCPVKFRRARAMMPLPMPIINGTLAELRQFFNLASDESFVLIVAFIVCAMRPRGPYPILALNGEQGSGKTTLARLIRALLDPNEAALRSEPRDERDLVIAANNGWSIGLDNLSRVQPWLSDALCRLSTGGGFATRELYTDSDEIIFAATRPTVINGIEELATRSDLLDRCIQISLPTIAEEHRRDEQSLWTAFNEAKPRLLGALFSAISCAMRNIDAVTLDRMPRMADAAKWIVAAEPALPWEPGAFMAAYAGNRSAAHELAIEASPVGYVVRTFVEERGSWSGTATELLTDLTGRLPHNGERPELPQGWPKKGNTLSSHLKRLAPNLRATGVSIKWDRDDTKSRTRTIKLELVGKTLSASSASSETPSVTPIPTILLDNQGTVRTIIGRSSDDTAISEGIMLDDPDALDDQTQLHSFSEVDLSDDEREILRNRAAVIELSGVPKPEADRRALRSINEGRLNEST